MDRYGRSLGIDRELQRLLTGEPEPLRDVSISLNNVANVLLRQGAVDDALARYEESLGIARELQRRLPAEPEPPRDVFVSLIKVASAKLAQGVVVNSVWIEALTIAESLAATFPDIPQHQEDLAGIRSIVATFPG